MKPKSNDSSKQYAGWARSNCWGTPLVDDQSRKHSKLLNKIVMWAMITAGIALTAFGIHTYYWFKNHAHQNSNPMPEPKATIHTVKHIVGELFNINAVPQFVELREMNIKPADLLKLRTALLRQFKKDVGDLSIKDCIDSITDKLNAA